MNTTIEFDGVELDIDYEFIPGEEESDIAGSSDQILIKTVIDGNQDVTRNYSGYKLMRMEEVIIDNHC